MSYRKGNIDLVKKIFLQITTNRLLLNNNRLPIINFVIKRINQIYKSTNKKPKFYL